MSLPWQLHFEDPLSRLKHIFDTKVLSDCTVLAGKGDSQLIKAHKLILSIASPVLHEKIKAIEGDDPKITVKDVEPEVFQSMLKYIYTGSVDVDSNSVYDLAEAAKIYQLPGLLKAYLDRIAATELTPQNVLQAYSLTLLTNENDLTRKCEEIIKTKIKEVLADRSFVEACPAVVEAVYSLDSLETDSELDLLNAVDRYAKHASKCDGAGNTGIRDILAKIRFLSLTPEQFAKAQSTTSVLAADDACAILAHIAYDKSSVPMPRGFSLRKDGRKRKSTELTLQVTFPKITAILNGDNAGFSPEYRLGDTKWQIKIKSYADSRKYLAMYAYCNWENMSTSWSCKAFVEFALLRSDEGKPHVYKYTYRFDASRNSWGFHDFIEAIELLNTDNHYIQDDAITLQVRIDIDELKGL